MKKIFIAICFIIINSLVSEAKITEISDPLAIPKTQSQEQPSSPKSHNITSQELEKFLEARIKSVVVEDKNKITSNNINYIRSLEAQKAIDEKDKTEFQKIYDNALAKLGKKTQNKQPSFSNISEQQRLLKKPNFAVIEAILPDSSQKVIIPAQEHIPYLFTKIDILPDGMVKFQETISIVVNNKKISKAISKILPKSILLRDNSKQNIDYTFVSAKINNQEAPYKLEKNFNNFSISPVDDIKLNPGVYTFEFVYLAKNIMGIYTDFDEFYWDITGSSWDLVIAKAGATITYPSSAEPLGQVVLVGGRQALSPDFGSITKLNPTSYGYYTIRPLYVGEGIHVISSLPHGIIQKLSFSDVSFQKINDHGDVVVSGLALLMIVVGFIVSGKYIRRNIGQLKVNFKKNAITSRFLATNRYDAKSFGAFILDLYKKNIIDIQQSDDTILLVKRTDDVKSLSMFEKKAVFAIFGSSEAVFNVNKNSIIKIKRASRYLEKELKLKMMSLRLRLNTGYILFSLAILFLGELFLATFANNLSMLLVLVPASLCLIAGSILFHLPFVNSVYSILSKSLGIALILLTILAMASTISIVAAIIILISVWTTFYFTTNHSKRNGLLKPYIDDACQQKEYLCKHKENIVLGKEIANQQANILALDLEKEFVPENYNEYYKIPTIIEMIKRIS